MPVLNKLRRIALTSAAGCLWMASTLAGAEYRGTVQTKGIPLPGVTLTATQAEKKVVTTSDQQGVYLFPNLAPGEWTVTTEMFGFDTVERKVVMADGAPPDSWELKLLSEQALLAKVEAKVQAKEEAKPAAPAPAASASATPANPAAGGPKPEGAPASPAPATAKKDAPSGTPQGRTTQGGAAQARNGGAQRRGPGGPNGNGGGGQFQRVDVNQSSDLALGQEGAIRTDEMADLNQASANSFIVQGSMSSAVGLEQRNDWGGPGGPGGGFGFGGPGMGGPGGGMGGPDGQGGPDGGMRGAGAGGRGPGGGGPGGGFGGGGFGGRGGGPGGGGPGGGFGGGGGGGFGGGRGMAGGRGAGGPGNWQGRRDSSSFGNARRNQQMRYFGSATFSLDNSIWDAKTFSVTGASVAKPAYAVGRAGIMFGGPLRIPKLVGPEKRIMFTFNYQMSHNHTGTISDPVNMPTALERVGDFSRTTLLQGGAVNIFDPATGLAFPGNIIPSSRLNSASLELLKYFPNPNLPFATRNFQTSYSGVSNSHNLNSRVSNIRIGSKARLNANIGYQGSNNVSPNLLQFIDTGSGRGLNAGLSWSHTIKKTLINNLSYNFSRSRSLATPYFANLTNVAASLGLQGTSQTPNNWGPPSLSFTNYSGLNDGNYSLMRNQTSAVSESLIYIRGKHNFTFGGDYRRQQFNQLADSNGRGTFSFNGSATSLLVNGVAQTGTGYDLADFLLGSPTTASLRYGSPDKYLRGNGGSLFFNDDWRMTSRFSLNGGLRWDLTSPVSELYNRMVNLDIASGYGAITPILPGQPAPTYGNLPNSLIHPDRNNISPRIGFALRPFKKDSLVVRGGYGVYYNTSIYSQIASNMAQQPPIAKVLSISGSPVNPIDMLNVFALPTGNSLTNTFAIDPNYKVGYAQSWTLSIQHDLPKSMFFTAAYLGTKGTRLDQQFIPNSVAPGDPASLLPHSYIFETSNGDSIYHAGNFQLNRRFRSGFLAHASYQFSKSIDNAGTGGRGQGGTPVAENWLDLSAERGLSSFDSRHNVQLQAQYSTGMGRTGGTLLSGWKGTLVKDWTISTTMNARTGTPFTATAGGNRSQVSGTAVSNTVRANATGLPIEAAGMLFNTAAFVQAPNGEWGNAGRDTIPGPTVFSLGGSLGRVFRFGERRSADLQFQGQNLLNHVTITNWGTVLGSSTYGLATAASQMRRITISLRIRF